MKIRVKISLISKILFTYLHILYPCCNLNYSIMSHVTEYLILTYNILALLCCLCFTKKRSLYVGGYNSLTIWQGLIYRGIGGSVWGTIWTHTQTYRTCSKSMSVLRYSNFFRNPKNIHSNRSHSWSATSVRNTKCFVQVQVRHIGAIVTGSTYSNLYQQKYQQPILIICWRLRNKVTVVTAVVSSSRSYNNRSIEQKL